MAGWASGRAIVAEAPREVELGDTSWFLELVVRPGAAVLACRFHRNAQTNAKMPRLVSCRQNGEAQVTPSRHALAYRVRRVDHRRMTCAEIEADRCLGYFLLCLHVSHWDDVSGLEETVIA